MRHSNPKNYLIAALFYWCAQEAVAAPVQSTLTDPVQTLMNDIAPPIQKARTPDKAAYNRQLAQLIHKMDDGLQIGIFVDCDQFPGRCPVYSSKDAADRPKIAKIALRIMSDLGLLGDPVFGNIPVPEPKKYSDLAGVRWINWSICAQVMRKMTQCGIMYNPLPTPRLPVSAIFETEPSGVRVLNFYLEPGPYKEKMLGK